MIEPIRQIPAAFREIANKVNQLIEWANAFRIDGATQMGGTWVVTPTQTRRAGGGSDVSFWAKIGASPSKESGKYRWAYAWVEVEHTSAGYGGWATKSGGLSGTTSVDPARNVIENMSADETSMQGNGVNTGGTDFPSTFDVMPAPSGAIVRMWVVGGEYWFQYANGVDGTC